MVIATWRKLLFGILAALALQAVGCAGRHRPPEWVGDPTLRVDPDTYFAAVGHGASRDAAEEDAREQLLAEILNATAHDARTSLDIAEYVRRATDAGGRPAVTANLLTLESFDAVAPLIGLAIVERHASKRRGHYALGVVSKPMLVDAYETEMRLNAALSNRLADRAQVEAVTLRKFAMLRTALVAAEAYNALRIARGHLAGPLTGYDPTLDPPDASTRELDAQIAQLRRSVAASIESVGLEPAPIIIATEIKSALQRLGVPVRTDAGEGQVRILVSFAVLPVHQHLDIAEMVNWRLSVEVVEDQSGRSLATLALDGKTGGKSLADAKAEAIRLARVELRAKIDEFLNRTLFEQALNTNGPRDE